jgi:hypothetical protein
MSETAGQVALGQVRQHAEVSRSGINVELDKLDEIANQVFDHAVDTSAKFDQVLKPSTPQPLAPGTESLDADSNLTFRLKAIFDRLIEARDVIIDTNTRIDL